MIDYKEKKRENLVYDRQTCFLTERFYTQTELKLYIHIFMR